MSDFTDFFPVSGGSGVGSGIPINGYFPFIVLSTDIPTGYDSTTGLYTHPDGTFWLRTGNTIISSDYPNATGPKSWSDNAGGTTYTARSFDQTTYDLDTNQFYGIDGQSLYVYDLAGAQVGATANLFTITGGLGQYASISTSPTEIYIWDRTRSICYVLNKATFALARQATYASIAGSTNISGGGYDRVNGTVWHYFTATRFVETNTALAPTGTTVAFTTWTSFFTTINQNPTTGDWVGVNTFSGGTVIYYFDSVFALKAVDANTNPSNPFPNSINATGSRPSTFWINGTIYYRSNNNTGLTVPYLIATTVGDGSSRTDTDSAQPLFVRIG